MTGSMQVWKKSGLALAVSSILVTGAALAASARFDSSFEQGEPQLLGGDGQRQGDR